MWLHADSQVGGDLDAEEQGLDGILKTVSIICCCLLLICFHVKMMIVFVEVKEFVIGLKNTFVICDKRLQNDTQVTW